VITNLAIASGTFTNAVPSYPCPKSQLMWSKMSAINRDSYISDQKVWHHWNEVLATARFVIITHFADQEGLFMCFFLFSLRYTPYEDQHQTGWATEVIDEKHDFVNRYLVRSSCVSVIVLVDLRVHDPNLAINRIVRFFKKKGPVTIYFLDYHWKKPFIWSSSKVWRRVYHNSTTV